MSNFNIPEVYSELFTAPLTAVTNAEAQYRKIWAKWIKTQINLLGNERVDAMTPAELQTLLSVAPAINLDGRVEAAITMRISKATSSQGGVSGGLTVGPVYLSGSFGFESRTASESTFQASTVFTLSNNSNSLSSYLSDRKIPVTNIAELNQAVALLEKDDDKS